MAKVELGDILDKGIYRTDLAVLDIQSQELVGILSVILSHSYGDSNVRLCFCDDEIKTDCNKLREGARSLLGKHGYKLMDTERQQRQAQELRSHAYSGLLKCLALLGSVRRTLEAEMLKEF